VHSRAGKFSSKDITIFGQRPIGSAFENILCSSFIEFMRNVTWVGIKPVALLGRVWCCVIIGIEWADHFFVHKRAVRNQELFNQTPGVAV